MRDKLCAIIPFFALAGALALAGSDTTWQATSNATNANLMVEASARAFVGELDAIHVHVENSGTSTVSVIMVSPYGAPELVIATNVVEVYRVFMPRETVTNGVDGVTARAVNTDGATPNQRFLMAGETLKATISGGVTNRTVRFRAVFKKE